MASPEINYNSLRESGNPFQAHGGTGASGSTPPPQNDQDFDSPNENEETPRNSGIMIHVVPETSRARWNHIENLDSFFTRMYYYHQNHGFVVIVCDEILTLIGFGFVVWLLTTAVHCIKYPVLFGDEKVSNDTTKVTLDDVIVPFGTCISNFGLWTYIVLIVASLFFLIKIVKVFYHIADYSDIKKFYNIALKIDDADLDNITWHEVQKKIREVQSEQHMCIDKEQLTELDIYHRILRFKNYMVALMNKNLLPVRYSLPLLGDITSLSSGLIWNVELILFRSPWSPFENNWQLREDYAMRGNQIELAKQLSRQILWIGIANLILLPFILVWQIIYISFGSAAVIRKEPGWLGVRTWSNFGRLNFRHFNELDHELEARLNRAYEPADRYMSSFSSPLMAVFARHILFKTGGFLIVILALGIYDEYVFQVEHVLSILALLTLIGVFCKIMIPNENLIWCPEQLLTTVLAHVHYLPPEWRNNAHTLNVRKGFENYFQFKAMYLLNEVSSPIVTPFILIFVFRAKSLEIVKFFRSFTVYVKGVGNVCSFAQMDIRKHGNPEWQLATSTDNPPANDDLLDMNERQQKAAQKYPVENGKTELSLVHFTLTNPEWKMPPDALNFMRGIRQNAMQDLVNARTPEKAVDNNTAMAQSLMSFGSIGDEYSSIAHSVFNNNHIASGRLGQSVFHQRKPPAMSVVQPTPGSSSSAQRNDFEHMLQQNLGDISQMPQRDILHDIHEADEDDAPAIRPTMSASMGNLMDKSCKRKGVRRSEGRLEGPSNSLLFSIYGVNQQMAANPTDITTADMCLSTLYLHEVHHRQKKRKDRLIAQSQRGWQRSPPNPTVTIVTSKAAESTPLLNTKRS